MRLCSARRGQVAGPGILLWRLDHLGPHRIQDHIPANLKKMAVLLDQDGFVSSLKEMTGPSVPFVEELGVHSIQLSHANG